LYADVTMFFVVSSHICITFLFIVLLT